MNHKKYYYRNLEVADMAECLGITLWGHTPDGALRVSHGTEDQPTGAMTADEIRAEFDVWFNVVPYRPGGVMVKAVAKRCQNCGEGPAIERVKYADDTGVGSMIVCQSCRDEKEPKPETLAEYKEASAIYHAEQKIADKEEV